MFEPQPNPHAEPDADQLFRVENDSYGKRLALIFGNHAHGGECPFFTAARCHHCDIGMGEGAAFDLTTNRQRLAWFQRRFEDEWASIAHLVIYNSGSVLNPVEFPCEFLQDVLAFARELPLLKGISLDSRESFVTIPRIRQIVEGLREDQCTRIILGIESSDDHIRNTLLQKGMTRRGIQNAFDRVAEVASGCEKPAGIDAVQPSAVQPALRRVGVMPHRVGIDANILVGGPGTTGQTAVTDSVNTAQFVLDRCRIPVDFNIHPYYPSSRGLRRFPDHVRCPTAVLFESVDAIMDLYENLEPRPQVFIGTNDEGHNTDSIGQIQEARSVDSLIRRFNATQERALLRDRTFDPVDAEKARSQ